jgi:hypothetical protein
MVHIMVTVCHVEFLRVGNSFHAPRNWGLLIYRDHELKILIKRPAIYMTPAIRDFTLFLCPARL